MDVWGAQWRPHDPLRMNGVVGCNNRDIVPLYAVQEVGLHARPPRSLTTYGQGTSRRSVHRDLWCRDVFTLR
jgi:hypothetical protein